VTRDVIMTLRLLLAAGAGRAFRGSLIRVPEMLVLVAIGVPLGAVPALAFAGVLVNGGGVLQPLGEFVPTSPISSSLRSPSWRCCWSSPGH
jgi:hypothetical protein